MRVLTAATIDLGLLHGTVDERVADQGFRKYFMHGTSHWLGLDVHDAGAYMQGGKPRPLVPGMVITRSSQDSTSAIIADPSKVFLPSFTGSASASRMTCLITESGLKC